MGDIFTLFICCATRKKHLHVYQFSSVTQLCPTFCDSIDRSMPGFLVHHQLPAVAAATANLLQSCLTLFNPTDGSPPGSSVPGILQARILEWVDISFSNASLHAESLQSCLTLCDPMNSSPPGSSVHEILQARILEWVAIPSPTNFQSLLQLMSIELVMPSNHLILCRPLLLPPSIFPSIRVFPSESALGIR